MSFSASELLSIRKFSQKFFFFCFSYVGHYCIVTPEANLHSRSLGLVRKNVTDVTPIAITTGDKCNFQMRALDYTHKLRNRFFSTQIKILMNKLRVQMQ